MKFYSILIILFIQTLLSFGQTRMISDKEYSSSGAINLMFATSKQEAVDLANKDINQDLPFLFIQSGIAPIIYETDRLFENKYKAYYYEQGCTAPDLHLMIEYNKIIFQHLTIKYKKKWQNEIRKDVIGFKEWKRNK